MPTPLIPLDFDPTQPFKGLRPDFGPFSGLLGNWAGVLLALVWAVCFVIVAIRLVISVVHAIRARNRHQADAMEEAMGAIGWPAAGVVLLASIPILWAVLYSGHA